MGWEIEIFCPLFIEGSVRVGKVLDWGFPALSRLETRFCYVDLTPLSSNPHFSVQASYYELASSPAAGTSPSVEIFTSAFL